MRALLVLLLASNAMALSRPMFTTRVSTVACDGKIATDCSITASTATLTCIGSHFAPGDVGKSIIVYEAGANSNGFLVPLSTTIAGYTSGTSVTLTASATNTAAPASHVAWGTDETTALQAEVDAFVAASGGGEIDYPAEVCLTRAIGMPCGAIGTFGGHVCTALYNNLTFKGAGPSSTIFENFDPTVAFNTYPGVINIGTAAEDPLAGTGNDRVKHIVIRDLALHQAMNAAQAVKLLYTYAVTDLQIQNVLFDHNSYEGASLGGSQKTQFARVYNSTASTVGVGGPVTSASTAAFNLNSYAVTALMNSATGSGQCFETGSQNSLYDSNTCDGTGVTASPAICFNCGSTGAGIYGNTYTRNTCTNYASVLAVTNGIGTINSTTFDHNTVNGINGNVTVQSGLDSNTVTVDFPDTTIHGTSYVTNNTWNITGAGTVNFPVSIGGAANQLGLESVVVTGNTVNWSALSCQGGANIHQACTADSQCPGSQCSLATGFIGITDEGGGSKWNPSTAYVSGTSASLVVANVDNGHYYRCTTSGTSGTTEPIWPTNGGTVSDGGAVWTDKGARPSVTISGTTITAPSLSVTNTYPQTGDINLNGTNRRYVHATFTAPYAWFYQTTSTPRVSEAFAQKPVANFTMDDADTWSTTQPTVGVFLLNDNVHSSATHGWTVSTAGRAAPTWVANHAQSFGDFAWPTSANGHVYMDVTASSCTTNASTQPTWPTGAGSTVSDGTCTWQESGAAAVFASY